MTNIEKEPDYQELFHRTMQKRLIHSSLPVIYYKVKIEKADAYTKGMASSMQRMFKDNYNDVFNKHVYKEGYFFKKGRGVNLIGEIEAEETLYLMYREAAWSGLCNEDNSIVGSIEDIIEYSESSAYRPKGFHIFIHGLCERKGLDEETKHKILKIIEKNLMKERSVFIQSPLPFTEKNQEVLVSKTSAKFFHLINEYNTDFTGA